MQFLEAKKYILQRIEHEVPAHFTYHNLAHTQDVFRSAGRIADKEGIGEDDRGLLLIAAAFHDSGFLISANDHEKYSCELAMENLPRYGYKARQLKKICGLIMATKLPQDPHNHLEMILSDADLDYLGRNDFFTIGDTLFREFLHRGIVKNEREWDLIQIRFLEGHHYFTDTCMRLRNKKKLANLEILREKINNSAAYEKG